MSFLPSLPRWWFRTPKTGLPPCFQMVGVADATGGVGVLLTYRAELIDIPEEGDPVVIPTELIQIQIVELPTLDVCRASGWTEEKVFTWEPPAPLELGESDTLS